MTHAAQLRARPERALHRLELRPASSQLDLSEGRGECTQGAAVGEVNLVEHAEGLTVSRQHKDHP